MGKHPMTPTGLKEGTTDREQIRRWWAQWPDANLGIVTGEASGIIVLDVDPRHNGRESLGELMQEHGELPESVEARTGSDGMHIFFRYPGIKIGNSAGKLGEGLDIRGDGGYVVAVPSLHACGERYRWDADPGRFTPIAMPPWMIGKLLGKPKASPSASTPSAGDTCRHWLGKALAESTTGKRNESGFKLACQLRDAGVTQSDAERTLIDYAARVPQGAEPYTEREAVASVRSAYAAAPRKPAENQSPHVASRVMRQAAQAMAAGEAGPADELRVQLDGICDGRIFNVPFSFQGLTRLTQALLPGTITNLVGDPGVGKTYLILQELQFWRGNDFPVAVFFIEKNRVFHTMRMLAQLEGNGNLVNLEWVKANRDVALAAWRRHRQVIDELGAHIHSAPLERVTFNSLLDWIVQKCKAGCRVLVVDPITAVSAGDNRWTKDEDFVIAAQSVLTSYGASLILVTHAKKGNRPGAPTMHDMAAGAAYARFADTSIWLQKSKKPREVKYCSPLGNASGKFSLFFQLHKTRNGRGGGLELAFTFGEGLKFAEQGIVLADADSDGD